MLQIILPSQNRLSLLGSRFQAVQEKVISLRLRDLHFLNKVRLNFFLLFYVETDNDYRDSVTTDSAHRRENDV